MNQTICDGCGKPIGQHANGLNLTWTDPGSLTLADDPGPFDFHNPDCLRAWTNGTAGS